MGYIGYIRYYTPNISSFKMNHEYISYILAEINKGSLNSLHFKILFKKIKHL